MRRFFIRISADSSLFLVWNSGLLGGFFLSSIFRFSWMLPDLNSRMSIVLCALLCVFFLFFTAYAVYIHHTPVFNTSVFMYCFCFGSWLWHLCSTYGSAAWLTAYSTATPHIAFACICACTFRWIHRSNRIILDCVTASAAIFAAAWVDVSFLLPLWASILQVETGR